MHTQETTAIPQVSCYTRTITRTGSLLDALDPNDPMVFQRLGKGIVATGRLIEQRFHGPSRIKDAAHWWRELVKQAHVVDETHSAGSGLLALGTFTFSEDSDQSSVLIVPQRIIGFDGTRCWETVISMDSTPEGERPAEMGTPSVIGPLEWREGQLNRTGFLRAVSQALSVIKTTPLSKVVLARDIVSTATQGLPWADVLGQLATLYPDTHLFAIDGFFGASPETLADVEGPTVTLQVLAGSSRRGDSPEADLAQQRALITSAKDLDEHRYAVENVVNSFRDRGIPVAADDVPSSVKLHNLWHLGSKVVATLPETWNSLDVVDALHPTAAVAGSPTGEALSAISALEPFDRGRYAGPVGWIDADGNGQWAIGLRCAQYSATEQTITAFAGAGIVANSLPEQEFLETSVKFQPIIDTFQHLVDQQFVEQGT